MKVVIIDNYDSFTYNLAHLVKELGAEVTVFRNDQFQLRELDRFDKIILSPGPGIPSEAEVTEKRKTDVYEKMDYDLCLCGCFSNRISPAHHPTI